MKRTNLIVALLCVVLLFVFTACSGGGSGNGNQGSGSKSAAGSSGESGSSAGGKQETVHLKLWGGVPAEAGPQEVIDNWNREHPNIQVEYVRYVNDDDGNLKLDTALMTGQGVDLYVSYYVPRLEKRVKAGKALDLTGMDYDIDGMIGQHAQDWKIDGKYYAIPTKLNNYFFWLNQDALNEAGLSVPGDDWTWEDVREYAKAMAKEGRYGLVQTLNEFDFPMDGAIAAAGGNVKPDGTSNLDEPYAVKYLEIMYNMMHVDKTTPPMGEQLATKMPAESMFLSGEAAMFYAGDWIFRFSNNMKDYPRDFHITFAKMPKIAADQPGFKIMAGVGDAISINPDSPHVEEAWEFLKWYADGGMLPMAKGGRVPASKNVDRQEVLKLLTYGAEGTYDEEALFHVLFSEKEEFQLNLEQQVIDIRKEEYQKYFTNAQSLEETVDRIVQRHNQFLNR